MIRTQKIENKLQKLKVDKQISSKNIARSFGKEEDYIEVHIHNLRDELLLSDYDYTNYSFPQEAIDESGYSKEINTDLTEYLKSKGFISGEYKITLNFHRRKIVNTFNTIRPFVLKSISSSRRELRIIAPSIKNDVLNSSLKSFISEIGGSAIFKDFILNFGDNINTVGINIKLDETSKQTEILVKLLDPLPSSVSRGDDFSIAETITDPITLKVDLGKEKQIDNTIPLQGPNFKIDTRLNNSIPSSYKSYNDILEYTLTSSFEQLLNQLENREIPAIDYTYVRPVTGSLEGIDIPSHFENFVHFSSAAERLKNFKYKIELIELYDEQIKEINSIPVPTLNSSFVINNREQIVTKKQKIIKGFDGYEQFLYYTSGSEYTWPKQNATSPFILYSYSSSQAISWLGDDKDAFANYGGQLKLAKHYDRRNEYSIANTTDVKHSESPSKHSSITILT